MKHLKDTDELGFEISIWEEENVKDEYQDVDYEECLFVCGKIVKTGGPCSIMGCHGQRDDICSAFMQPKIFCGDSQSAQTSKY